jgi:CRISPR-associated endonuclease Cas1
VADGYGVQVRVRNRCLVVSDGIGRFRRERVLAKPLTAIWRLVILGHEGSISLEALRWIHDAGISFVQIDRDGEPLCSSAHYGLNDARLRRALALARNNRAGYEIARFVIAEKLAGQTKVLKRPDFAVIEPGKLLDIAELVETALKAKSLKELLLAESAGAATYWGAWRDIEVKFARQDDKRIPEHWRTFGPRSSPLTSSPRLAANPANAMLNYLYALIEAETRFACLACGLDPGLGIFHADQRNRDSLTLDLMEAARPKVDAYLLDLLAARTFTAKDFVETRKGVCRVLAPVTHTLAETTGQWARAVAPVVENVTAMLAANSASRIERLPTPLTQTNRSAGRDAIRRRPIKSATASRRKPAATCATCGGQLPSGERQFCDDCLPDERRQLEISFSAAGVAALAKMRAEGRDPLDSAEARRKLGEANARRRREEVEWDRTHDKPDPAVFTREILPRIQGMSLSKMKAATGLSTTMCAKIRRGYVPHPRHWEALRTLNHSITSKA